MITKGISSAFIPHVQGCEDWQKQPQFVTDPRLVLERKRSEFVSLAPVGRTNTWGLVLIACFYFRDAELHRIAEAAEGHLERRDRIGFHLDWVGNRTDADEDLELGEAPGTSWQHDLHGLTGFML